jgi:cobalt transporter subunit CbtA
MLMRILATGLVAGVLAGGIVAGLQTVTTTPLVLKAEIYEKAEAAHEHGAPASTPVHSHDAAAPAESHDAAGAEEWEPAEGLERTAFTTLATVSAGIGFAFILLAVILASGATPTARTGLLWAAAAFAATGLAPALGLPPELPGAASAELIARQLWWVGTALATAAGIWLIARYGTPLTVALGIALIVAPHLIGAPHPHELKSEVPAEIAGHFTATSLVIQAVLWMLAGSIAGWLWERADSRVGAT